MDKSIDNRSLGTNLEGPDQEQLVRAFREISRPILPTTDLEELLDVLIESVVVLCTSSVDWGSILPG